MKTQPPKTIAIIPARAGSKGIPHKNMVLLGGKPLLSYTIQAALKSRFISQTIVSSDGDEILRTAEAGGAKAWKRPPELAQDTTPSEDVVSDVLNRIGESFECLILLQPTSPFRTAEDIDNALNTYWNSKATALISGYEPSHHPLKSFVLDPNGFLKGAVNDRFPFMRRQDLPKGFMPNGAIYIIGVETFLSGNSFFTPETVPFYMSPAKSVDIDSPEDLELAEFYVKKGVSKA